MRGESIGPEGSKKGGALSLTPQAKPLARSAGPESYSNSCLGGQGKSRARPRSRNGLKAYLGSQGLSGLCTWPSSGREHHTKSGYTDRNKKVLWDSLPAPLTGGQVE